MSPELIAFIIVQALLLIYLILGGIDLGYGVLYGLGELVPRFKPLQRSVITVMTPLWEANHVFLIVHYVALISFFPAIADYFSGPLFIPVVAMTVLFSLRGACFIADYYIPQVQKRVGMGRKMVRLIFAFSSFLLPSCLSVLITFPRWNSFTMGSDGATVYSLSTIVFNPLQLGFSLFYTLWCMVAAWLVLKLTTTQQKLAVSYYLSGFLLVCLFILTFVQLCFYGYPWLIINHISLQEAFVGEPMFSALILGLLVGSPLLLIGPFVFLYWLFFGKKISG